jgi:cytochrome c oxidase cbb3-type subunit 3
MSSRCRNPEPMRVAPIVLAALLSLAATSASAQQDPSADNGPKEVSVSGIFPNGGTPPPPDPTGARFEGNKLAIADGQALFGEMNCTGCHFNGGGGMGPALMSGNWRYGGRIDQLYESIAQGRPNGMPSWQFLLQPTQIWELAAYVKSLAEPTTAAKP